MDKRQKIKTTVISSALTLTFTLFGASCGTKKTSETRIRSSYTQNKTLEDRVDRELEKRAALVRNNPLYLSLVSQLKEGRAEFKSKNYDAAFNTFGDILKNNRYASFPEYSFAKFYIASTLSRMGIQYGALLYYVDLIENEPLRIHTHEALAQSIDIAQKLGDDELILYLASVIKEDKVPKSLREEFRYFIAKDLWLKKNYKTAVKLLKSISRSNRLYLGSQYLLGAIAVETKQFRHATQFFREISTLEKVSMYHEGAKIKQLANLALGRIFYEQKNYPLSVVFYGKVNKDKVYYPQALYETSWALFKMNQFNPALSVLHSVNSPFYEQVFFLKSYLLKGAIFLELCLYDDALTALGSVEKDFEALGKQIDTFARRAQSPKDYYPLLTSTTLDADGSYTYAYRDLFNLSSANRDFWKQHKYIRELQSERERLEQTNTPRGRIIANLIRQKERELVDQASWLAGQKLLLTRNLIKDFFALKDFLRYEIVSTERKILQTRSLRLAPPVDMNAKLVLPEFTESLRESLVWWEYSGEYWEDELGAYLYNLKSICKEKSQPK